MMMQPGLLARNKSDAQPKRLYLAVDLITRRNWFIGIEDCRTDETLIGTS